MKWWWRRRREIRDWRILMNKLSITMCMRIYAVVVYVVMYSHFSSTYNIHMKICKEIKWGWKIKIKVYDWLMMMELTDIQARHWINLKIFSTIRSHQIFYRTTICIVSMQKLRRLINFLPFCITTTKSCRAIYNSKFSPLIDTSELS